MHRPRIIGVGGFSSDVGKTSLMCQLLKVFPGWEAIKTTRGHYRSCGKDPHACCVSHLLNDRPVVRSGREETYTAGKDTGRYWDAGATNVHWLIATDEQVELGIQQTLARVRAEGVFIEGNSFSEFIEVDALIMAVREDDARIKGSARRALRRTSALYVWRGSHPSDKRYGLAAGLSSNADLGDQISRIPVYTAETFPDLVADLRGINSSVTV